jgi:hypothetical protein
MTGSQHATRAACERAAGASLAAARAERTEVAAVGGAEAVARWAAPHLDKAGQAEMAEYWKGLVQQQEGGTSAA